MIKLKIKKGDKVRIIAGKDKGREGEVIRSIPTKSRLIIAGINMVKHHTKAGQDGSAGGILSKEASIHISNVAFLDGDDAVKIGYKINKDGIKNRISRKSGEIVD